MNSIKRVISKFAEFMSARPASNETRQLIAAKTPSQYGTSISGKPRNFDGDFRSASDMLRERLGQRFPDNFHARVGSDATSTRDFGNERAGAIDTASAAIAAALREGATARQAADAGAASVGI